jgi:undecaprenyl phosphate N,N'-diacetylbacillosamine 1-phosphate transferase
MALELKSSLCAPNPGSTSFNDVIFNNVDTSKSINIRKGFYVKHGKRLVDITVSTFILLLSAPILLLTCLLVRLTMGKSVFFKQIRIGLNEKQFTILKIRTMTNAVDANNNLLPDSQRTPRIGRIIRQLSIDELPQLLNVLKGEMSLVGPRPLYTYYLPYYSNREKLRHTVRPGITGWAQVHGRNATTWNARLENDAFYVENLSLKLDLLVIFKTIYKIFKSDEIESGAVTSIGYLSEERKGQPA